MRLTKQDLLYKVFKEFLLNIQYQKPSLWGTEFHTKAAGHAYDFFHNLAYTVGYENACTILNIKRGPVTAQLNLELLLTDSLRELGHYIDARKITIKQYLQHYSENEYGLHYIHPAVYMPDYRYPADPFRNVPDGIWDTLRITEDPELYDAIEVGIENCILTHVYPWATILKTDFVIQKLIT